MKVGNKQRRHDVATIRRRDIMAGAWALMESKGILNVTMDDIARKAEYTKQTVYSYFASKDELLIAIHLDLFRGRWRDLLVLMEAESTSLGKLQAFGEGYYRYFTSHPADLQLLVYLDLRGLYFCDAYKRLYAEQREFLDATEQYMQQALRQGQEEGTVRPGLDLWWTLSYIYLSLRANLNEALMNKKISDAKRRSVYFTFLNILLRGLAPSPGQPAEQRRGTRKTS